MSQQRKACIDHHGSRLRISECDQSGDPQWFNTDYKDIFLLQDRPTTKPTNSSLHNNQSQQFQAIYCNRRLELPIIWFVVIWSVQFGAWQQARCYDLELSNNEFAHGEQHTHKAREALNWMLIHRPSWKLLCGKFGKSIIMIWDHSYSAPPPCVSQLSHMHNSALPWWSKWNMLIVCR